jgi:8-hydroxy-5-deazaflavin:NADPH oxidoreductase
MKVGILGSGDVAKSLAKGFVAIGDTVKLGTRTPSNPVLLGWASEQGGKISVGTFAEAAAFGEIGVLATLGSAGAEAVKAAGPAHFDGKVLIDVTNPLVMQENAPPRLYVGTTSSAGEQLQAQLPKAKVVKAFNIVGNPLFFRPSLPGGPPDMFIAGNDAGAKATVAKVLQAFGWPAPIDIGGIDGARELESLCLLWVKAGLSLQNFQIAFRLLR